jgi:hypothetical protein
MTQVVMKTEPTLTLPLPLAHTFTLTDMSTLMVNPGNAI